MSATPEASPPPVDDLETAADKAIAASGGDARDAVKSLIVAHDFLERRLPGCRRWSRPATPAAGSRSRGVRRIGEMSEVTITVPCPSSPPTTASPLRKR